MPRAWHTAGHRIVYLAESPAGALVEVLVHLELEEAELPRSYTLLQIKVPDDLIVTTIEVPEGDLWQTDHELSRRLGDAWLARAETAIARVPSALLPRTFNCLLNPAHPDSRRVQIEIIVRPRFDPRLLRALRG